MNYRRNASLFGSLVFAAVILVSGCSTPLTTREKGAGIGALGGAAAGGIIGSAGGNPGGGGSGEPGLLVPTADPRGLAGEALGAPLAQSS